MADWASAGVFLSKSVGKFDRAGIGEVDRHVLVEAEGLGRVDHPVRPRVDAHLGEGRVARDPQDLEERAAAVEPPKLRIGRVVPAACSALVTG